MAGPWWCSKGDRLPNLQLFCAIPRASSLNMCSRTASRTEEYTRATMFLAQCDGLFLQIPVASLSKSLAAPDCLRDRLPQPLCVLVRRIARALSLPRPRHSRGASIRRPSLPPACFLVQHNSTFVYFREARRLKARPGVAWGREQHAIRNPAPPAGSVTASVALFHGLTE
jgi:hypothetical protein